MAENKIKKFEVLENSPDIKLKIFGSSPKDIFKNALHSLGFIQKPEIVEQSAVGAFIGRLRGKRMSYDFSIESMDYNTLLVDFLSDVLLHSENQNAVFFEVKFKEFSENKITGRIYGLKADELKENVKAVIYHEVDIKQNESGQWESILALDV